MCYQKAVKSLIRFDKLILIIHVTHYPLPLQTLMYQYLILRYGNISYLLCCVLKIGKSDIKGFLLFLKKNRGMGSGNFTKVLPIP